MNPLRIDRLARRTGSVGGPAGTVLGRCHVARGAAARAVGLLATPRLDAGEGVWLEPCASVHSAFLRVRIGVAFVDAGGAVVRVVDPLPRWRVAGARGARAAVEAPAGTLAGLRPGDRLTLHEPPTLNRRA
ncbi:MAG: DUF192 domain-containing protein [Thermoleophilia bacterium]|nr:DUF192 domain-containing protein [Thermoleophilia bacterium]